MVIEVTLLFLIALEYCVLLSSYSHIHLNSGKSTIKAIDPSLIGNKNKLGKRMADIIDTILVDGNFKNLFAAIQAAELIDTLRGAGPFTVFAPEDYAFTKLPTGTLDELMKNPPKLKALVTYHIIEGKVTAEEMSKMKSAVTLQGQEVKIDAQKWHLHVNPKINDAKVTIRDQNVDNGVIHVVDKVLMPNMDLTCPVCGAGFESFEVLNIHTKTAHQPETKPVKEQAPEEETHMS